VYKAVAQIEGMISPVLDEILTELQTKAEKALTNADRQRYSEAFIQLHRQRPMVIAQFSRSLRELVERDMNEGAVSPAVATIESVAPTKLTLVDDAVISEEIEAKRISQKIESLAEWELRDLDALINSMQGLTEPDAKRNPLRPELVSRSLHRALQDAAQEQSTRNVLAGHLGDALSQAMRYSYGRIADDLKRRNIKPLGYVSRVSEGMGHLGGLDSGPAIAKAPAASVSEEATAQVAVTLSQALNAVFGVVGAATSRGAQHGKLAVPPDGELPAIEERMLAPATMSKLRDILEQLNELAADARGDASGFSDSGFSDSARRARSFAVTRPIQRGPAVANLVRAHQAELQASTNDESFQRTIEVVAALFDHILSDASIAPLMARLIGRLQLPMLQVALRDPQLFVSPSHPLHALINRLGQAASAHDEYDAGPGQRMYAACLTIVEQVLEGDHLLMMTYEDALAKLSAFIKQEARTDSPSHADAARVLTLKELRLHLEHHMRKHVDPLVRQMPIEPYLREFLEKVWVAAQVEAVMRYGEKSGESMRFKRLCSDLIWSVQPKATADDRRQLVSALPYLMRDVNEAFALLRWPPMQQKEFRARLLENHAKVMKADEPGANAGAASELIEQLRNLTVPSIEVAPADDLAPGALAADDIDFTDVEKAQTGIMTEQDLLEAETVDVDIFGDTLGSDTSELSDNIQKEIDTNSSIAMIMGMKPGLAYEIKMAGTWKKLRLSWVSDMQTFYVFVHSGDYKSRISLSGATLMRAWQRGSIRTHEQVALMARAIEATRHELQEKS
jgi:hypothetical protein